MFDIIEEMNTKQLYKEIYNRFGFIKRARFCFLYTKKGIRLTDMFLEGQLNTCKKLNIDYREEKFVIEETIQLKIIITTTLTNKRNTNEL